MEQNNQTKQNKRIITWDEYFMSVAKLSSFRSKDPNTQVGACIVSNENRIISVGYNGLPKGCHDSAYPWNQVSGTLDQTKYAYVVHAELNAILNATQVLKDSIIFTSLFPCHECVKAIIQSGIKEIVYSDDKYDGTPSDLAAKKMLKDANVSYRKIKEINIKIQD